MLSPLISVVIPAFNNGPVLAEALCALQKQTVPLGEYEVLIVDDGSTDNTLALVSRLGLPSSFCLYQRPNRGAAASRNFGAQASAADLLLFLDSDTIADPDLVEEHLGNHREHDRVIVVGRTRALPAAESDHFLSVMGESIFAFAPDVRAQPLSFQEVLTRNLSVKRSAFTEIGGFDEEYPGSGYEDVEFAYRAIKLGYDLLYNPNAAGTHQHTGTLAEVAKHMYKYQIMAALTIKKHPEVRPLIEHLRDKEPIRWTQDRPALVLRKLYRQGLALPLARRLLEWTVRWTEVVYPQPALLRCLYWQILGSHLLLGYREGLRQYGI